MRKKPLSTGSEWSFELIQTYDEEIARIAKDFKLDTYPNQIEVISAEQMMDAYSSVGMPIGYHHWSFGKHFVGVEKSYKRGQMGLAYELVINSNPCISYLMEENTMAMQALVIAHACYGHNSFFKNNYLYKMWTSADAIIDYLVFARKYISDCELRYGIDEVESILDACHALMNYGVDRYKHPSGLSIQEEKIRQQNREMYLQSQVNELWRTIPQKKKMDENGRKKRFPEEPQENILYFIEKNAPLLEPWQREIVRIVRKVAQYFYPQGQTKVMNEGWACFWHYTLLHALYDEGLVTDEFMLEILQSHTNVIMQPPYNSPYYNGINPYTLGYHMMQDIKRICENPTEEDKRWFPYLVHKDWLSSLDSAMRNFKDESFIAQYLSPRLIRELKLFHIIDDDQQPELIVNAIHDESGYAKIRSALSKQYNLGNLEPDIQVFSVDTEGDRSLTLHYSQQNHVPLADTALDVLKHLYALWKFPVVLKTIDSEGNIVSELHCPPLNREKNT
ncbi:SpoVR family protein [Legionella israelensis]|uniref:SpoVR family protein n=1 Tax=Legionella israelensis TaxID=454 RepID=A0A0W0W434_9GAMM|nr:SpoVR family protein [Legionella israelensis]KTD26958.1 SpoVR family protein [Legionella israelensis]QBR85145.1 SpoVR family protein [Legionella israelensis]QBS09952.1 SpoVR family protein [Legionella israelensis]QDP71249.1 SpoVR family protein [Legionella israelensis]SCY28986.1 Stage V sporulation protein SpoVR/YcgB, involved in spore cortex formation [Legionella israelensis DSM 19235]